MLELQIGVLALLIGGVDDELAGLHVAADAHAGQPGRRRARRRAIMAAEAPHDADDVEEVDLPSATSEVATMCTSLREAVREARANRDGRSCGR